MAADGILSIGIVGAGEIVRRLHLPVLANIPDVRVTWICDSRAERARALGKTYGVRAVRPLALSDLPQCDVALVAIPVEARRDYLLHFARGGTAVLCEKPFAMTAHTHRELVALFPPYALGCGFMRRFYRSTTLLRHIVTSDMLGAPRKIHVSEGNRSKGSGVDSSFLDDPRLGASRGVLMDLGSHSIDLALFVCGAERFEVTSSKKELDGAVDRKVTATAKLHRSTGASARTMELDYGVSWVDRQTNQIRLHFEQAIVWSELGVAGSVFLGDPASPRKSVLLTSPLPGATTFNQAFYLEWRSFLDGVRTQRESLVSARSALLTTALSEQLLAPAGASHG